ncbi:hypothetical protein LXA43DRAFT_1096515 [Ganoderma leucocontextum]|nr:hypothetical protein LXA43DRAFT_1096515 [Ganoderma leucocontextum]
MLQPGITSSLPSSMPPRNGLAAVIGTPRTDLAASPAPCASVVAPCVDGLCSEMARSVPRDDDQGGASTHGPRSDAFPLEGPSALTDNVPVTPVAGGSVVQAGAATSTGECTTAFVRALR